MTLDQRRDEWREGATILEEIMEAFPCVHNRVGPAMPGQAAARLILPLEQMEEEPFKLRAQRAPFIPGHKGEFLQEMLMVEGMPLARGEARGLRLAPCVEIVFVKRALGTHTLLLAYRRGRAGPGAFRGWTRIVRASEQVIRAHLQHVGQRGEPLIGGGLFAVF
jgi:hypothetical protein